MIINNVYICSKCPPSARTQARIDAGTKSRTASSINTVFRLLARSTCVISVSQHLKSWYSLEADILSMWCKDDVTYYTFDDFWDNNYQSCLWLFNNSLKCTCTALMAQSVNSNVISQASADTYFRWSGHFMHCFVKCLFRNMRTNYYWNRYIFYRHKTKNKLARFLRHGLHI